MVIRASNRKRFKRVARPSWCATVALLFFFGARASVCTAASTVDFNRDVRPILSANCFKCHGIDEGARKSKLRLDQFSTATSPAKSGKLAIVAGKPEESELVRRVFSDDPDQRMPPESTRVLLSDAQKQTLRLWISQGAKYETHWAFVPPVQSPLPAVKQADWPKNAIDRFVLAKLESAGMSPSPEADRYTLIRRVSLDLIGLPPTPAETDAFVNDPSPDAYEHVVDRLLASPHYGERWARRWLDLARYADTNGFEKDRPRSIWPYRDWVINALNADMPFDQFTVEQLAGDMLPNATPSQRIATGFHRNTMLNEEGGIDPLEYRFRSAVDRINTTGTAWLGLTVRCAQCHTHKFDPILHDEYYGLMALLNNVDEPTMAVPDEKIQAKRDEIQKKIDALTAALPLRFPAGEESDGDDRSEDQRRKDALEEAFAAWEQRASAHAVRWTVLRPAQLSSTTPFLTTLPDDSVLAGGDIAKSDSYDLTFHTDLHGITAIRLEALPHPSLPNNGPGMVYYEGQAGGFFLSEISLAADGAAAKFNKAINSFAAPRLTASAAIDGDPQTGWSIDGGQGKPQEAIFVLQSPIDSARELKLHMLFERYFAAPLGHFRISVTSDPRAADSAALPTEVEAALAVSKDQRSGVQHDILMAYFLQTARELTGPRLEIDKLRATLPSLPTTLVMSERPAGHARKTFVHHRGEFLQATKEAAPGVPSFLPPLPKDAEPNRLTFARWLVSPQNPLTARVTVNRQWQAFFGRGIVRTLEDFGYQGDLPTHPQLLDWLAVQFMRDGWSLKRLHRLIVTSAAYRQSSRVTPDLLERDPQNLLLSRGPRFRLEAELIRDSALCASGLLSEKIGGPSVFPPQPNSVTAEDSYGNVPWRASSGDDRYRRSLYTYAKRAAPFALYNTFDGPTGDECVARREISNTPLQALSLLNDMTFVEAAQALGKSMAAENGSDEARINVLFRRCLTRPPEPQEVQMLTQFLSQQRDHFSENEPAARKVAGGNENMIERAAWTAVARAVMNLDEMVTKN